MPTCASCGAELKPEWKFCIKCGTPNPDAATLTDEQEPEPEPEAIPAAIRPEPADTTDMEPLAAVAIVLAIAGAVPAFVYGPLALLIPALAPIPGHLALRRIRTSGARGKVFAIVATVLGYCWFAVWAVFLADAINTAAI